MSEKKINLLFYDPEKNVLAGLKRALYSMRKQWDMIFVSEISRAEQLLFEQTPDVLVADISASDRHGLQLLQKAQHSLAGTIRIGTSGDTNEATAMLALYPTHRFLAKPFDNEDFKALIFRALYLRDRLNDPRVISFVNQVEKLPAVPVLIQQINQLLLREEVTLTDIADLIENDINITTQLLKIVNSAYFGLFKEISSVRQAVNLLGLEFIKGLILGISLFKGADNPPATTPLIEGIWQHSLMVARILQRIVSEEQHNQQLAATAFTLGIVHDVGKLIFIAALKEDYVKLCREAFQTKQACWLLEKKHYHLTHADAGAYLLGLWGLPDTLVFAVAESHHYENRQNGSDYLSNLLRVIDALSSDGAPPDATLPAVQNWLRIAKEYVKENAREQ